MAVGQVGRRGAAVPPVFAREIREFEQELAPIRSQVKTESTVTKETVHSKWTAWVSIAYLSFKNGWFYQSSRSLVNKVPSVLANLDRSTKNSKSFRLLLPNLKK